MWASKSILTQPCSHLTQSNLVLAVETTAPAPAETTGILVPEHTHLDNCPQDKPVPGAANPSGAVDLLHGDDVVPVYQQYTHQHPCHGDSHLLQERPWAPGHVAYLLPLCFCRPPPQLAPLGSLPVAVHWITVFFST